MERSLMIGLIILIVGIICIGFTSGIIMGVPIGGIILGGFGWICIGVGLIKISKSNKKKR